MNVIITFLVNLFTTILKKQDIIYFDMLDEYEDYLSGNDVSVKDTLIGTVKSEQQYEINFHHNFYHIPERFVDSPDKIKYVALYRSKKLFYGKDTGIKHYGKVISYEHTKRDSVRNANISYSSSEEYYYRFEIECWQELERCITVREKAPHVAYMTNFYMLNNSYSVNELFLADNNEFKLNLALRDVISGVYQGFFIGEKRVYVKRSRIFLILPNGKKSYKVKQYKRYPLATLKKISEELFSTPSPK